MICLIFLSNHATKPPTRKMASLQGGCWGFELPFFFAGGRGVKFLRHLGRILVRLSTCCCFPWFEVVDLLQAKMVSDSALWKYRILDFRIWSLQRSACAHRMFGDVWGFGKLQDSLPWNYHSPWKLVVGRLLCFWEGPLSGAMLVLGRVSDMGKSVGNDWRSLKHRETTAAFPAQGTGCARPPFWWNFMEALCGFSFQTAWIHPGSMKYVCSKSFSSFIFCPFTKASAFTAVPRQLSSCCYLLGDGFKCFNFHPWGNDPII